MVIVVVNVADITVVRATAPRPAALALIQIAQEWEWAAARDETVDKLTALPVSSPLVALPPPAAFQVLALSHPMLR
jgi:hypothetical protein